MQPVCRNPQKLKDYIYGENETTLEEAVAEMLTSLKHASRSLKVGTKGEFFGT